MAPTVLSLGSVQQPRLRRTRRKLIARNEAGAIVAGDFHELHFDLRGLNDHLRDVSDRARPIELHRMIFVAQVF